MHESEAYTHARVEEVTGIQSGCINQKLINCFKYGS